MLHEAETAGRLRIGDARSWGDAYRGRIEAHRDGVTTIARRRGWTVSAHHTDRPATEAALRILALVSGHRVGAPAGVA